MRKAEELCLLKFGERGIRTLEGLLTLTPLAGERFRPLSHLSKKNGAPKRSRTPNLQIRSLTLYPIELWAHILLIMVCTKH